MDERKINDLNDESVEISKEHSKEIFELYGRDISIYKNLGKKKK